MPAKYEDQSDSTDSICPYCGDRYQVESEDYSEDRREVECDECGKKYWLEQSFTVTHQTSPDCALNGESHKFDRPYPKGAEKPTAYFCSVCGKCILADSKK